MPRNANTGVYTPPANSWNPATPDTVISSADWNALRNDMATALNHAPSTTRALHPTTGQVQDGAFVWGGTAGGTADALTLTLTPAITAYATGMVVRFVAAADNTSATPTLSINGVTPAVIAREDGAALAAGDIKAGSVYEVMYSGTQWRLTSITVQQAQGNEGAQSVSGTSVLELPDNASAVQIVDMTVDGASVCLPDATLQSIGKTKFVIYNNGNADFFIRPCRKMPLKNGDFANTAAWTLGTGWSIGSGVATKTSGSASDLSQPLATEDKATYEITFTITTISGGSVRVGLVGGASDVLGTQRNAPGTYTEILTSNGSTTFVLRADESFDGSVDNIVCKRHEPTALALLRPKQIAHFSLLSNDTPHGVWSYYDNISSPPKLSGAASAPSSITTISHTSCALNDYQVLHFGKNSSNHLFAYVVEYKSNGVTVGTPTLVSTTNETLGGAHLVNVGKVLFCYGSKVYIAIINGTTVSISSPVSANTFTDKRTAGPGPKKVQLGDTVVIGSNAMLQAVNCSGTTPVAGSAVMLSGTNPSVVAVFPQPSNRVVCFYTDGSSSYRLNAVVATVSGTTINLHTTSSVSVSSDSITGAVLEMSPSLYLFAVAVSSGGVGVSAVTVSENSATFHPLVNFNTENNPIFFPSGSFQNEMFQKLSDTEALLIVNRAPGPAVVFAHIKVNGTALTINNMKKSNYNSFEARSLILFKNKKIYYDVTSNVQYANGFVYELEFENNTFGFRPLPNMRFSPDSPSADHRSIKINECGFVTFTVNHNIGFVDSPLSTRIVFVQTKTKNECIAPFPLSCRLKNSFKAEEITQQKTALYGESLLHGQILHYLIEGVV